MFISRKKQKAREQAAYELGLNKGFDLCWQMRQVERNDKGLIVAGKLDQELENIQR